MEMTESLDIAGAQAPAKMGGSRRRGKYMPGLEARRNRANDQLFKHVGDLTDFSTVLIVLAELSPERTTAAQLAFFLTAAIADLAGKPATFTELREATGPLIGKSLHTTYQVFLDKERRRSDVASTQMGVGWLTREIDPTDNRRNYLRLTAKGREIIREVIAAATGKEN